MFCIRVSLQRYRTFRKGDAPLGANRFGAPGVPTRPDGTHAIVQSDKMRGMYHYNPSTALEELTEDATLPNPVHVRDMMLRRKLNADQSLELNRIFLEYQKFFGEAQKLGKEILTRLAK
jgi:hypothetical protein